MSNNKKGMMKLFFIFLLLFVSYATADGNQGVIVSIKSSSIDGQSGMITSGVITLKSDSKGQVATRVNPNLKEEILFNLAYTAGQVDELNFNDIYPKTSNSEEIKFVKIAKTGSTGAIREAITHGRVDIMGYWIEITGESQQEQKPENEGSSGDGSCNIWQPPQTGICSSCNSDDYCTEYECKSIRINCGFYNDRCFECIEDTDNDGLCYELEKIIGTNPNSADTDKDGFSDKEERDKGTDPLDPNDHPGSIVQLPIAVTGLVIQFDKSVETLADGSGRKVLKSFETNFDVNVFVINGITPITCSYTYSGTRKGVRLSNTFTTEQIPFTEGLNVVFECTDDNGVIGRNTLNVFKESGLKIDWPVNFNKNGNNNEVNDGNDEFEIISKGENPSKIKCSYQINNGGDNLDFPKGCDKITNIREKTNCLWSIRHAAKLIDFVPNGFDLYKIKISCESVEGEKSTSPEYNINVKLNQLTITNLVKIKRGSDIEITLNGNVEGGIGNSIECGYNKFTTYPLTPLALQRELDSLDFDAIPATNNLIITKTNEREYTITKDLSLDGKNAYYGVVCRDVTNNEIIGRKYIEISKYITAIDFNIAPTVYGNDGYADITITSTGGINNNGKADCKFLKSSSSPADAVWDYVNSLIPSDDNRNSFVFRVPQEGEFFTSGDNRFVFRCYDYDLRSNHKDKVGVYRPNYGNNRLSVSSFECINCDANSENGLNQEWGITTSGGPKKGDADCQYRCCENAFCSKDIVYNDFTNVEYDSQEEIKSYRINFIIDGVNIKNNKDYGCEYKCNDGITGEKYNLKNVRFKTKSLSINDFGIYYKDEFNQFRKKSSGDEIGFEEVYLGVETKKGLNENGKAVCRYTNMLLNDLKDDDGNYNLFKDISGLTSYYPNLIVRDINLEEIKDTETKSYYTRISLEDLKEKPDGSKKAYTYYIQCRDTDFVKGRWGQANGVEKGLAALNFIVNFEDVDVDIVNPSYNEEVEGKEVNLIFTARGGTNKGTNKEGIMDECVIYESEFDQTTEKKRVNGNDRSQVEYLEDSQGGSKERYTKFNVKLDNLNTGSHIYEVVCKDYNKKSIGSDSVSFKNVVNPYIVSETWNVKDKVENGRVDWILVASGGEKGNGRGKCSYEVSVSNKKGDFSLDKTTGGSSQFSASIDVSSLGGVYTFTATCSDDDFDNNENDNKVFIHEGVLVEKTVTTTGAGQCKVDRIYAGNTNCRCGNTEVTSSNYGKYCCESGVLKDKKENCPGVCAEANCKDNCGSYVDCVVDNSNICKDERKVCCSGACTGKAPAPECGNLKAVWTDNRGTLLTSTEINENTQVWVTLQGENCKDKEFELQLLEVDEMGIWGRNEADVTSSAAFSPNKIKFEKSNVAFNLWTTKYVKDENDLDKDPEYIFRIVETNIESPKLKIKKIITPGNECKDKCVLKSCDTYESCISVTGKDCSGGYCCSDTCTIEKQIPDLQISNLDINPKDSEGKIMTDHPKIKFRLTGGTGQAECYYDIAYGKEDSNHKFISTSKGELEFEFTKTFYESLPNSVYSDYLVWCKDGIKRAKLDIPSFTVNVVKSCEEMGNKLYDVECKDMKDKNNGDCGIGSGLNTQTGKYCCEKDCSVPVSGCNNINECNIDEVKLVWVNIKLDELENAFEKDTVRLFAVGFKNCECLDVNFNIVENDGLFSIQPDPNVNIAPITKKIDKNLVSADWVARYDKDTNVLPIKEDPEYVFGVKIGDKEKRWSNELNVKKPNILFTGNSIKDSEQFTKDNNTWKIEVELTKEKRNVGLKFIYNNYNFDLLMIKQGNKYYADKNLFTNALTIGGVTLDNGNLPLGEFTYEVVAYDEDWREATTDNGGKTLPRKFNVVEFGAFCTNGETRTGICQLVNNCATHETCVNGKWDGSCVDVPNDNCPCGNNYVDNGETCDGNNFGGVISDCASYPGEGFISGSLKCFASGTQNQCHFDTSECTAGTPGGAEDTEPVVSIGATPNNGNAPLTVSFTTAITSGNSPFTYSWDFNNDGQLDKAGQTSSSETHTYVDVGTYTAKVKVRDSDGDEAESTVIVTATSSGPSGGAEDTEPVVSIGATPNNGNAPLTVSFTTAITSGNSPFTYSWDFNNDGTYEIIGDSSRTRNYQYDNPGNYVAKVRVTDSDNDFDEATIAIIVTQAGGGTGPGARTPLAIDSVSSNDGNIVTITSGGIGDDGSANCAVYNNIAMTTKIADLYSTVLSKDIRAHTYTHIIAGTYNGWWVKCIDNENTIDIRSEPVPSFTVTRTTPGARTPLAIDSVSSNDGNIVTITSGGIGDDGSANCAVYESIARTNKIADLISTTLNPTIRAHTYTYTVAGTYNGWWLYCVDNENSADYRSKIVPDFTVSGTGPTIPTCDSDGTCETGETASNCPNDCGPCSNGAVRECGVTDLGECSLGTQTCTNNVWPACSGNVGPVIEICNNNLDDDCDGSVDEGCSPCSNGATKTCGTEVGICTRGIQTCMNNAWNICNGVNPVPNEICNNNLDDDCDGSVNEGCEVVCTTVYDPVCGVNGVTYSNSCLAQAAGVGIAHTGACVCIPTTEVCNDGIDNDCDNFVDCLDTSNCNSASNCQSCNTACPAAICNPREEVCGNNLDDDCDGNADEGCSGVSCQINSIKWVNKDGVVLSTVNEGSIAYTIIQGNNCNIGTTVNYEIFEKDELFGIDIAAEDDQIVSPTLVTFDLQNLAFISWTATRQVDQNNPNNAYYVKIYDKKSGLLAVNAGGVLPGCIPSTEICNDGKDNDCDGKIDCTDENCYTASNCLTANLLKIQNIGPSNSNTFNFELYITLSGGSSDNGIATCYWNNELNPQMNNPNVLPGAFNNQVMGTYTHEFVRGIFSTRYSTSLARGNGEHNFYIRCVDGAGRSTELQQLKVSVNVADANILKIIDEGIEPTNPQGSSTVNIKIKTSGGANNGANVQCSYSGDLGNGNLNKILKNGNIYEHTNTITGVSNGNKNLIITCTDNIQSPVTKTINFNVAIDTTPPRIVQIITQGSNRYVKTDEEALCKLSTTSNVDSGADLSRDESKTKHLVVTSSSYYVKCRDKWNNVMPNVIKVNI